MNAEALMSHPQIPVPHVYRIAGLDLGSNAVRMSIAETFCPQFHRVVKYSRKPLRLGESVFKTGHISRQAIKEAVEFFTHFRDLLWKFKVDYHVAVGTSALRDAVNRDEFLSAVYQSTGISIQVIPGEEEAELVCNAVSKSVSMGARPTVLMDIGGGSVEFTYVLDGKRVTSASYPMGTLRALQLMRERNLKDVDVQEVALAYRPFVQEFINKKIKGLEAPRLLVGTGGNCERYGKFQAQFKGSMDATHVERAQLGQIRQALESMSLEERIDNFKLEADRADVVVPAGAIIQMVMEEFKLEEMQTPGVGLRDGLLYSLSQEIFSGQGLARN